jgi:NAD(P)-dependent dehydrogenase (short-subunit alcohol dehydrogenase family)
MLVDSVAEWAQQTAAMIETEGGTSRIVEGDVSDTASCKMIVARTTDAWGRLDILVNNVGITGPRGNAIDVDLDAWDHAMRVNVASMMLTAKYAIPEMIRSGGGSIINLTSVAGLQGGHPSLLYPTSKGAVISLTRAMAAHHGRDGIRVNCIAPGTVYTPMVASRGMTPEMRKARSERTLLGTEGTGWDIGYGALFLASDEARWITGITLPIDGGATAGSQASPVPPSEPTRA